RVPKEAVTWRPAPGKWTVHEVVIHCADSEVNAHMRLRFLLGQDNPAIMAYDEARWAIDLDYHALPLEPAFTAVRAVRANTVPLLHRLTETQWSRTGNHPDHRSYGVETWLQIYAEHLEIHERQIERTLKQWGDRRKP